ncbi:MAG: NAD(P)-dependent oxidoreductase [Vicinamibacterales bacterium]
MKPLVLVTEGSDPEPLAWLKSRVEVVELPVDSPDLRPRLAEVQGLVVRTYTIVTDALLARLPKLKVVARGGVGLDNIDVSACRRRGVEVVYTPAANTLAVADFVFGLMLALLRPVRSFGPEVADPAAFKRYRAELRARQLNEMTLGILGMGRIGHRVGRIAANGFGMRVLYNDLVDRSGSVDFAATAVSKETLYAESDVVTLHVDLRAGNEGLVGTEALAAMKRDALLINTCRGEVLDAFALADALSRGRLAGAAVDVFAEEPPPPTHPLLGAPRVILTPHIAARTETGLTNMSWVVRDVVEVLEGRPPTYPAPHD